MELYLIEPKDEHLPLRYHTYNIPFIIHLIETLYNNMKHLNLTYLSNRYCTNHIKYGYFFKDSVFDVIKLSKCL